MGNFGSLINLTPGRWEEAKFPEGTRTNTLGLKGPELDRGLPCRGDSADHRTATSPCSVGGKNCI